MREGGKLLEVQTLDHLIVTTEGYYSFADEGLL
jgi:DNA repair protein RadC